MSHGDGLIVKVSRHWTLPPRTYVINVFDGTEISGMKPRGLGDNPELSPDGEWIAFDTEYVDGLYQSQIYIARLDNGKRIQLTHHDMGSLSPTWSPDGSQIAYEASGKIYVLDVPCALTEKNCEFIPKLVASGEYPNWAPDGEHLVYVEFGYGLVSDKVFVIGVDNLANPINITPSGASACSNPDWSRDEPKVVFSCDGNIYIVTMNDFAISQVGNGGLPKWSPDGKRIVFVSAESDDLRKPLDMEGSIRSNAIYVMNVDGSDVERITPRSDERILWFTWFP